MRIGNKSMTSPYYISHRMGMVADYKDQYQHDYSKEYTDEVLLMKPVLEHMKEAIDEIRAILGE